MEGMLGQRGVDDIFEPKLDLALGGIQRTGTDEACGAPQKEHEVEITHAGAIGDTSIEVRGA